MTEGDVEAAKLIKVLNYDGTPITARFILREIEKRMADANVVPLRKAAP
jgi:2-oxoglutarate ferredoxin oxidoreductase subunit alpha